MVRYQRKHDSLPPDAPHPHPHSPHPPTPTHPTPSHLPTPTHPTPGVPAARPCGRAVRRHHAGLSSTAPLQTGCLGAGRAECQDRRESLCYKSRVPALASPCYASIARPSRPPLPPPPPRVAGPTRGKELAVDPRARSNERHGPVVEVHEALHRHRADRVGIWRGCEWQQSWPRDWRT